MPRNNPVDLVGKTVEKTVRGSAAVADRWHEEMAQLESSRAEVLDLAQEYKRRGLKAPITMRARLREISRDFKTLEGQVARYSADSLKDIERQLAADKVTPGAGFYRDLINDMETRLLRAKKKVQFRGADLRQDINQLRGDLATLRQRLPIAGTTGIETGGARPKAPARSKVQEAYVKQVERWRQVQTRLKWPKDKRLSDVSDWIDLQITVINRRIKRGEYDANVETAIKRVSRKISEIEAVTRAQAVLKSPADARKMIAVLRRKAVAMKQKTRRDPKEIAALQQEIEALASGFRAREKAEWSKREEKAIVEDIRTLKAVAAVMARAKGQPKHPVRLKAGNPKAKKKAKKKTKGVHLQGSGRGGARCLPFASTVGPAKAKKKAAKRKATPSWQRAIRRCQKLWEHYCERPSKKRLQDVIKYLETMETSASKKVLDERKTCLRAVNTEKKRWKMK